MSKQGEIPYTWEETEKQIRDAILCMARVLQAYGPGWGNARLLAEFLGITEEEAATKDPYEVENVDLSRHVIYQLVRKAYIYAYQLDGWWDCTTDDWGEIEALLLAYPQADENGEWSPLTAEHDYPLRLMIETFLARFKLFDPGVSGGPLTVRELSLLANMTVPAVRNSLSRESFKLDRVKASRRSGAEEKEYRLNEEDAIKWLSRRRGFIPQREMPEFVNGEASKVLIQNILSDLGVAFNLRVRNAVESSGKTIKAFAEANNIEPGWMSSMIAGEAVTIDIDALRAIARGFDYPEPDLAGEGVRFLLSSQPSTPSA